VFIKEWNRGKINEKSPPFKEGKQGGITNNLNF